LQNVNDVMVVDAIVAVVTADAITADEPIRPATVSPANPILSELRMRER
jgi:hypothetical protein